jgi:hypothetical protein
MKRVVSLLLVCLLLFDVGAALAAEAHRIWDIPFGTGQEELRGLIEAQMGVAFDTEESVHRTMGTRTIYINRVKNVKQYGYLLDRFAVVMNDPEGDGDAKFEGLLLIYREMPLGELPAPGDVSVKKLTPAAKRLSALIQAMTEAYGESTFSQYVLHYNNMSSKEQPIGDLVDMGSAETWAQWFKQWNAFLITIDWGNVNLLCATVRRSKYTYVQAMLSFSETTG